MKATRSLRESSSITPRALPVGKTLFRARVERQIGLRLALFIRANAAAQGDPVRAASLMRVHPRFFFSEFDALRRKGVQPDETLHRQRFPEGKDPRCVVDEILAQEEAGYISWALQQTGGDRKTAAKLLKLRPRRLEELMGSYGITPQ